MRRRRGDSDQDLVEWDEGPPPRERVFERQVDPRTGVPALRGRRGLALLGVGAVVLAVIVLVDGQGSPPPRASAPLSTTSNHPGIISTAQLPAVSPSTGPSRPPVAVTDLGHPLLLDSAGWELFGLGDGVAVRVQPALGRITTTRVPTLQSSGPAWFVAAAGRALIRPIDYVPGYVIRDGRPAQQMPAGLSEAGPMFPGPDAEHVWVDHAEGPHPSMALVGLDDLRTRAVIPLPPDTSPVGASPDGAGYLMVPGTGGVYDARPGGLRRITTGIVLAAGPTGWLASECDARHRCSTVVIERARWSRRVIGPGRTLAGPIGVINPAGTIAAVFQSGANGATEVVLVDLRSGAAHRLDVAQHEWFGEGTVVWSPDGRWLFALGGEGQLFVVDPRTRQVRSLGVDLPQLTRLATRPTR